jgi:hypothetical protein|tara:strand:- start:20 stop:1663 length:1644 start_codon:yes stop_codon:yes gene_type:complete
VIDKIVKKTKRTSTIFVKIRDLFNYESKLPREVLEQMPSILSINPNAKKQRKRKKDKAKKDNIICYPFIQMEYGQNGMVTELKEPKEVYSHILKKTITAKYDASSFSHRLEDLNDFLHGDYKTPILSGAIQKSDLKELKNFYKDPNTNEPIDISNMSCKEIFKYPHIKEDFLDYEMCIVIQAPNLNPETISRNNKFVNSGESFSSWEAFRSSEHAVINYISDFSFQTNEKKNDEKLHPLYKLQNNLDIETVDKGIILKDEVDKNASYFENGCYLFINSLNAVRRIPVNDWKQLSERDIQSKIIGIEEVANPVANWMSRMNDYGCLFFQSVNKLPKDFISFHLLTYIISDIELRFGGKFQIRENDWKKFAKKMDDIHDTLHSSSELLFEKTWKESAPDDQTYPICKYRTKKNLLNFGLRLVLDYLYDTSKADLGLGKLDIIVKPLTGLSIDTKRKVRTRQTEGTKIKCDMNGRFYPIEDLQYCHIEAKSLGLFNDNQVNDPENIRLAHKNYNRMMGTLNYHSFKEVYKKNSKRIDEQLGLLPKEKEVN